VTVCEHNNINKSYGAIMSIENSLNANKIIQRVKDVIGIKTNYELSKVLQIKPNTISSWKKRGNIDLNKIISICEQYKISTDWILYGKGGECVAAPNDPTNKIMEMLESMTDEQRRDVLKYVEKEKLLEELMKNRKIA